MISENPQQIDPREIERPFSEQFITRLGNAGFDPSAFLIDDEIGIEPVDVNESQIFIRFTCDKQKRIIREKALDKDQPSRKEEAGGGISRLMLKLTDSQKIVFINGVYKLSYLVEQSGYRNRKFVIESTSPLNIRPFRGESLFDYLTAKKWLSSL